ncbi:phage head spike fiber domain-containing protein [Aeromonas caviae]|uniref:phage head spike fiber domain-containing protein n=1 Tax=Aeromonas caviae TaxID=648 RepID=UPI000DE5BFEE|nr:hypothetical protein [Aeromonas caviae]
MAGVWKRDGTVAVTNGNKKVTGTGTTFADTKNGVAKGHLFCITSGTSVDFYEVDYVVSNTELYLVQAYRGVTATGKAYEIITTFSDSVPEFARRLTATLSAYQQQSDAFQALLTSTATTVEVTAPDGTKQTLIPWKRVTSEGEGQAARAKTEADKAAASAALAGDIVVASALPLPDVWAPLSDSLRLITGYGREVKVGEDVVARMVNFSRNSTATYIGKDGQLKTAAVNEPRFEKEGLLVEGQSTNLFLNSENVAVWPNPPAGPVSTREMQAVQGGLVTCKVTATSVNGGVRQTYTSPAGGVHTVSFYLSKNSQSLKFLLENGGAAWGMGAQAVIAPATGTITEIISITSAKSIPFLDGYIYQLTLPAGKAGGILNAEWRLNAAGDFYIGMPQLEALPFASSYIPTAGAAVTRAADIVTIPWALNMPLTNMTVALNYDIAGLFPLASHRLIEYASPAVPRYILQIANTGDFESYTSTYPLKVANPSLGPGSLAVASTTPTRHALKLTGKNIVTSTPSGPPGVTANITLGAGPGAAASMYGHLRNLRIWHRALTDDQLKAVA